MSEKLTVFSSLRFIKKYYLFYKVLIDRYLINIGKKQLFGSQYFYDDSTAPCYCIEQVEKNFPDNLRRKHTNTSLHKRYEILASVFNKGKKCANAECRKTLKPTPKGSVPGLW